MHGSDFDINIKELSKIEGHGDLDVKVRNGNVEEVKLKIMESKRFFTQAVRGADFRNVHQVVSRICGTCSIAHLICCIKAVESAIGFVPSEQTTLLRKLSTYGLYIRDHALHLYLFSLPDVVGKDSVLDFEGEEEEYLKQAFKVKAAGNNLSKLVAGRAVHATYPQVGGFSHIPEKEKVAESIKELKSIREDVLELIDIFHNCKFEFKRSTRLVALSNDEYNFIEGSICSTDGVCKGDFLEHLNRVVIPYSQAAGFKFEGGEYAVGSIARMAINKDSLHKDTKRDAAKYIAGFSPDNIFHNNTAQAIEILHSIDRSIELMESTDFVNEPVPELKPAGGEGIGVIEAPRGTLYYLMHLQSDGKVKDVTFVIPTAQNQIRMESDIRQLVQNNLDMEKGKLEFEIEKLIRAYDPCMSCATHFLKVNWM